MIFNYELEQHLLSGLIKHPETYPEIAPFISEKDFYSEDSSVNKTIFSVLRSSLDKGESLDEIILSQRLKSLGISFEDNINVTDYIKALAMRKISAKSVLKAARELKKITIRREISNAGLDIAKKMKSMSPESSYEEIIDASDKTYNATVDIYESGDDKPKNIYSEMESIVEDRGNNPIDDFGPVGPHPRLHEMYGSLVRPGNISVIVARSGVGKTQFCMDFCTKISRDNNHLPILHFDNGEMSKEELIMRQCASLSGVQMSLIETGRWRQAGDEVVNKVRKVWKQINDMQFHYYNCGGMSVDQMCNVIRRFYYSVVGRGNPMIFSFDYIKTTFETGGSKTEWQIVGEMVDKFKKLIQKELVINGTPYVAMVTSVQMNRIGTSRNRSAANIVEDETVVSLSDRITQFCSHMFLLRQKEPDEIAEHASFGTHKLVSLKARHLGQDPMGAIQPVRMADGSLRNNYLNLDFNNFNITERGDLRDLVEHVRMSDINPEEDGEGGLPELFNEQ